MPLKPRRIRKPAVKVTKPKRKAPKKHVWNATKIPKGFVLLVDTREQKPLFVSPPDGLVVKRATVHTGDYTVEGYEDRVCVERKQLSDFDSFMGAERNTKTIPKLKRMSAMDWSALIIEETHKKLFGKRKYGRMTPEHARGFLVKVEVGYGIHTYWTKVRADLEWYVLDRLCKAYEIMQEK